MFTRLCGCSRVCLAVHVFVWREKEKRREVVYEVDNGCLDCKCTCIFEIEGYVALIKRCEREEDKEKKAEKEDKENKDEKEDEERKAEKEDEDGEKEENGGEEND